MTYSITARNPSYQFENDRGGVTGFTRVVGDFVLTERLRTFGDVYLVRKSMSEEDEVQAGRRIEDDIKEIEEHGVPDEQADHRE